MLSQVLLPMISCAVFKDPSTPVTVMMNPSLWIKIMVAGNAPWIESMWLDPGSICPGISVEICQKTVDLLPR